MFKYHAYELTFPLTHPYDNNDYRWASFVGEFLRPISAQFPNLLYWSTCYGATVEFKVFTDNISDIDPALDKLRAGGFKINPLNRTLDEDLGGGRFIGPDSTSSSSRRAKLILLSLKALCDLIVDSVRKRDDGYWEQEQSGDTSNNPVGNHFFSVLHLHHLITDSDAAIHPFRTPDGKLHLLGYIDYENNKLGIGPHTPLPPHRVRL